eukprot:TRINITY_DN24144_c0_g2_i1.p1 TRINITY_DN24144_c0_g2~~TRINITY_DN24144_c0_g2_i1.p1  ORF type:complete len:112 (-),score=24.35 TRINITY_DN24144_c0_g2_i1:173-508(-)
MYSVHVVSLVTMGDIANYFANCLNESTNGADSVGFEIELWNRLDEICSADGSHNMHCNYLSNQPLQTTKPSKMFPTVVASSVPFQSGTKGDDPFHNSRHLFRFKVTILAFV